jgi:hypothetical protein
MISNNAYVNDITMYMSLVSIYYVDSIDRVNKVLPTSLLTLLLTLLLNITTTHQRGTTQIINQQLP